MKKKLVASLAAAMVLGVAGTSFAAANPFTDVPAKHWAYDSVMKLAQAGVVDGYGDGTYRGDKLISRYEMAQMVAKAMARSDKADAAQKAQIDKLAVEFAEELNTLGVRVTSLEKKVGTIKVSGDARLRFVDNDTKDNKFAERFRLNLAADVNENTKFYGRFVVADHNEFGTNTNTKDQITDMAFTTKNLLGTSNTATTLGRFSQKFGNLGYFSDTTGLVDGAKITAGNKLKLTAGFANFKPNTDYSAAKGGLVLEETAFAEASYDLSKATNVKALWLKEMTGYNSDFDVLGASVSTRLGSDIGLAADYTQNTAIANDPTTLVARVTYKGAKSAVQGTYGVYGEYLKFEQGANVTTLTGAWVPVYNVKGYNVGVDYTLAKNITLNAMHMFNAKVASNGNDAPDYTRAQVNYMF